MKIIGILFLFISILFFGFYLSEKYISILNDIKRADRLLKNIILGLESENLTVKEIFEFSKKSGDEKTLCFLNSISPKDFCKITKKSVETGFCKDKAVNSYLEEAFFVLGKYTAYEQIREINICRNKINDYYKKEEKTIYEKAKLSGYSGIFAGILAVILFI